MPKNSFLKLSYLIMTFPISLIANALLKFSPDEFEEKLKKCIKTVDDNQSEVPDFYVPYLVTAEDHRFNFHYGIDHIGILRALYKRLFSSKIQGASTIEQQFVRVVLCDYSHSLKRKLKEQLLAVLLVKNRDKADISKAYLAIAYYGYKCQGLGGIKNLLHGGLQHASEEEIISIVARLKYPKPAVDTKRWKQKHENRIVYIKKRHNVTAINLRNRISRSST